MSLLLYVVRHQRRSNFSGDSMAMVFFPSNAILMFFGHTNTIATVAIILMKPSLATFFVFSFSYYFIYTIS